MIFPNDVKKVIQTRNIDNMLAIALWND